MYECRCHKNFEVDWTSECWDIRNVQNGHPILYFIQWLQCWSFNIVFYQMSKISKQSSFWRYKKSCSHRGKIHSITVLVIQYCFLSNQGPKSQNSYFFQVQICTPGKREWLHNWSFNICILFKNVKIKQSISRDIWKFHFMFKENVWHCFWFLKYKLFITKEKNKVRYTLCWS